ncbi:hypothetical protein MSC49_42820 (plasmid) [Methylosinus sp. C49]|nr:hypothetical protein MSC49_42820 [Methylosinus sp. C49]
MRDQPRERGNADVVGGVQLHRPDIQPFLLQRSASSFATPEITASEQNIRAATRKASRDGQSNAAIGAADQGKNLIGFHFIRPG